MRLISCYSNHPDRPLPLHYSASLLACHRAYRWNHTRWPRRTRQPCTMRGGGLVPAVSCSRRSSKDPTVSDLQSLAQHCGPDIVGSRPGRSGSVAEALHEAGQGTLFSRQFPSPCTMPTTLARITQAPLSAMSSSPSHKSPRTLWPPGKGALPGR